MAAKSGAAAPKSAAKKKSGAARKKAAPKKAAARKSAPKKATTQKSTGMGKSDAGYSKNAWKKQGSANSQAGSASEQPMMKALRAEHRHMASVMELFGQQLDSIEAGRLVDTHVVYEVMDYMVTFPDRFHHPREDLIYGRVAELDSKAADDVDTLQRDHDSNAERGRGVLKEIERWRSGEITGETVVKTGRGYIDHLYEHMNIEEKVVFPHIEAMLTVEDWRELSDDDRLRPVMDPVFGPRVHREFRNLARKLRGKVRRTVERGTMVEWIGIDAFMESLEVLSMALESARHSAGDHLQAALDDSRDMFREAPLSAPVQCALNNTKLTIRLLEEVANISRDTFKDLSRVNQERLDRIRLLDR